MNRPGLIRGAYLIRRSRAQRPREHCRSIRLALLASLLPGIAFAVPTDRGSLLIFSKVEIKWDAAGHVTQDTFLAFRNHHSADSVDVAVYFINGDQPLDEACTGEPCDALVRLAEPGWNTADCRFRLGRGQTMQWTATEGSAGCQSFVVLDKQGPGRPDPETHMTTNVLRGYAVAFAVGFNPNAVGHPNGQYQELRFNLLTGSAAILDYLTGRVWYYDPWIFRALNVPHGTFTGTPGVLNLDNVEYDAPYASLSFGFTGSGDYPQEFGGVLTRVDTDLTLHPVSADLRQDNDGPVVTKAEVYVTNGFGSRFSGTRRCISCWDEKLLSAYTSVAVPNHFLRTNIGTDFGVAEIRGLASRECDDLPPFFDTSQSAALLGIAAQMVTFDPGGPNEYTETWGTNLSGIGVMPAVIRYDPSDGSGEVRLPTRTQGKGSDRDDGRGNDGAGQDRPVRGK